MKPLRIGIVVESTGLPLRQAVAEAAKMGAAGIQVDAVGDLSPDALGETGRREFRNLLRSFNQDLAALNVPLRRGLDVAENLQPRLEHIRKVMQLAFDLGSRRVVVPCPRIPDDASSPRAQLLRESLLALGPYGDRVGTVLALEIGFDPAEKVKQYLAGFDTGSLKVTYDPANMLLHGHDPLANLAPLKDWLAHIHARDARSAGLSRGLQEVPLGAGDIDWMAFTATLQVLEYDGFLVVEREQGENKLADVTNGVKFLKRFAGPFV
ncbi:MAG TPA: sugar phosphate isomerase/epimerase family protein [Gemmataceae bacterium]|nr:sugar phosphate isomerase/epimerase family protein [Gemmataceae bacterium]